MRAYPETADIAIGCQPEPVAELAVISLADQRIRPARGAVHRCPLKQPGVEAQVRRKPPRAKAEPGIGELHWVLEETVKRDPGARIRLQLGIAALKKMSCVVIFVLTGR
jgi:hypothetical protein